MRLVIISAYIQQTTDFEFIDDNRLGQQRRRETETFDWTYQNTVCIWNSW